jgi:ABC-2 type transport system permease protein
MTALIRSELRKLCTTRWFPITAIVTMLVGPAGALANVFAANAETKATLGDEATIRHILSTSAMTSLVALAIGISVSAGEYRRGTCIPTFLITPRRRDVVLAKLVTTAVIGALMSAAAFAVTVAVAAPALSSRGVHHLTSDVAQMLFGATVTGALYGALGVALGAITRSTVVAMVAALGWSFAIEANLLAAALPGVAKWMPTGANLAITRTGNFAAMLDPPIALVVLLAWATIAVAIAIRITEAKDI